MKNNQKLIMESWRHYLKENNKKALEETFASLEEESEGIEEGLASTLLAALMALSGPAELQIDGNQIVLDQNEIQQVDNMLSKMNQKAGAGGQWAGVDIEDINQAAKDLNADAQDGKIDNPLSSSPERGFDKGEAMLAQLILHVNDTGNDSGPESSGASPASPQSALEKATAEYKADPSPVKLMKLQRAKTAAGQGSLEFIKERNNT